jgi:glycosyltransferase involved in cell wall biosynthesis
MRFFVATPSFNQVALLRSCVASIADQTSPSHRVHHHVQDGGSSDGTTAWLREYAARVEPDTLYSFSFESSCDDGMYDAVNRAWRRSGGDVDVLAYLNCDEQYLTGALQTVAENLTRVNADILYGDVVVVDARGGYVCSRTVVRPTERHVLGSHLPTFTAATFIRRETVMRHGLFFDTAWRDCGDAEWTLRALRRKVGMHILHAYLAAFTDSGENMNLGPNAAAERVSLRDICGGRLKWPTRWLDLEHRIKKALAGAYTLKPFSYALYGSDTAAGRQLHRVEEPTGVWRTRLGRAPP